MSQWEAQPGKGIWFCCAPISSFYKPSTPLAVVTNCVTASPRGPSQYRAPVGKAVHKEGISASQHLKEVQNKPTDTESANMAPRRLVIAIFPCFTS